MSVVEWFAIGAGIALALWWWRFCVRQTMWTWNNHVDVGKPKPNIPAGLFGGTAMFLGTPFWIPVYGFIKGFEKIDGHKLLTERVFPEPK